VGFFFSGLRAKIIEKKILLPFSFSSFLRCRRTFGSSFYIAFDALSRIREGFQAWADENIFPPFFR